MAGETTLNVREDAILLYSDIPPLTGTNPSSAQTAQSLRILNRVHRELLNMLPLVTSLQTLTLDGTSREYSISENYVAIWTAEYLFTATSQPQILDPTSVEQLNADQPGWRTTFPGVPFRWYSFQGSSGPILGFDPIPPTATVAGYPTVRYQVSEYVALTAAGTIPSTVDTADVYVMGLAAYWGKYTKKDNWQETWAMYEDAKQRLDGFLTMKQKNNPPTINPFMRGGPAQT